MPVKTKKNKPTAKEGKKPAKKKHVLKIKVKKTTAKKADEKTSLITAVATPIAPDQKIKNQASAGAGLPKDEDRDAFVKAPKIISENVERDKNLILWSGVVFFMILIIFFWVRQTGKIFQKTEPENDTISTLSDWRTAADDIASRMNELRSDLEKIRIKSEEKSGTSTNQVLELSQEASPASTTPDAATTSASVKAEEVEKLKIRLEELEKLIKTEN